MFLSGPFPNQDPLSLVSRETTDRSCSSIGNLMSTSRMENKSQGVDINGGSALMLVLHLSVYLQN